MSVERGLVDWHTNLWLPEHLGEQWAEMGARAARGSMTADPAAHRAKVASCAEYFVVLGLKFDRLGIHVPHEFVAEYVREFPGRAVGF